MARRTRKAPIQIMGTGTPIFPARQKRRQRSERLQVELSPDEIAAVDEFRYRARMPSRAAAVRELLAAAPGLYCPCFPSMQTTTRPLARFIPSAKHSSLL